MILQRANPFKSTAIAQPVHSSFPPTLPSPFATLTQLLWVSQHVLGCCSVSTSILLLQWPTYHVSDVGIRPLQLHLFSRAGVYPGVGPVDHGDGHFFLNQVNSL